MPGGPAVAVVAGVPSVPSPFPREARGRPALTTGPSLPPVPPTALEPIVTGRRAGGTGAGIRPSPASR
ncbi:hypothetical protein SUDANB126_03326 [Streptomyces sp. enrichment culture]